MSRRSCLLVFLILIIPSCNFLAPLPPATVNPSLRDPNQFFTSLDCIDSCWNGMRPGVTTTAELLHFYNNDPLFSGRLSREDHFNEYTFYYRDYGQSSGVVSITHNDTLVIMIIRDKTDLKLGDIIAAIDIPNYIHIRQRQAFVGDQVSVLLTLYYPERGLTFELDSSGGLVSNWIGDNNIEVCLDEDLYVSNSTVLSASSIEEFVRNSTGAIPQFRPSERAIQKILDELMPWPGMTCIQQEIG